MYLISAEGHEKAGVHILIIKKLIKTQKLYYDYCNIMTFVIKHSRGKKKNGERSIDGFRKKKQNLIFQNVQSTKSNQK